MHERKQINLIQSIGKDANGYTTINVAPVGSKNECEFYPHNIIEQPLLKKQFRLIDIKLIESVLIAEGDVFIESKEYRENMEFLVLSSKLDKKQWLMTSDQLRSQKEILHRINKRFFSENSFINLSVNYP